MALYQQRSRLEPIGELRRIKKATVRKSAAFVSICLTTRQASHWLNGFQCTVEAPAVPTNHLRNSGSDVSTVGGSLRYFGTNGTGLLGSDLAGI